jgi:hypothetical protein
LHVTDVQRYRDMVESQRARHLFKNSLYRAALAHDAKVVHESIEGQGAADIISPYDSKSCSCCHPRKRFSGKEINMSVTTQTSLAPAKDFEH